MTRIHRAGAVHDPDPAIEPDAGGTPLRSGPVHELARRFAAQPLAVAGLAVLLTMVVIAILAPVVAPYGPDEVHRVDRDGSATPLPRVNEGPSRQFLLGTDDVGRDVLSRVVHGARVSIRAGFQIVAMALIAALPLGLLAGYFRGWVDSIVMRIMDALFTFPPLILALAVAAVLGERTLDNLVLAVSIVFVPGFTRLVRGQVLAVREETYVEAARATGARPARIIVRHVLPNVASPLIVHAALSVGFAILVEAGLSFLGFGAQPPTPTWGGMLSRAFDFVFDAQWQLIPPGLAILVTVLATNLVGDGLRDALGRETHAGTRR